MGSVTLRRSRRGSKVNYPFGFGLSYTQFAIDQIRGEEKDGMIRLSACVTNVGERGGKGSGSGLCAGPSGKAGQAGKNPCLLVKTRLLAPGETQTVFLSFTVDSLASYDDLGKVAKSAYVCEAGGYRFHLGNSVRDTVEVPFVHTEPADRVVQQLTQRVAPVALPERMLADGSYEALPVIQAEKRIGTRPL